VTTIASTWRGRWPCGTSSTGPVILAPRLGVDSTSSLKKSIPRDGPNSIPGSDENERQQNRLVVDASLRGEHLDCLEAVEVGLGPMTLPPMTEQAFLIFTAWEADLLDEPELRSRLGERSQGA